MTSRKPVPRLTTHTTLSTLEDDRDPGMLAIGLSLLDTQAIRGKPPEPVREKRRTLDDMRALSEHIKRVARLRGG